MTTLEPGCLVMCYMGHPDNVGKTARLVRYVGALEGFLAEDLWLTDREWTFRRTVDPTVLEGHPYQSAKHLRRIDGPVVTEEMSEEVEI